MPLDSNSNYTSDILLMTEKHGNDNNFTLISRHITRVELISSTNVMD